MNRPLSQKGVVIIEAALSFLVFLIAFMAIIELSRLGFALNSANEATRLAARLASVCSMAQSQSDTQKIQTKVEYLINASGLVDTSQNPSWLQLSYANASNSACTGNDCVFVRASIPNLQFRPLLIPSVNFTLTVNVSSVALRESFNDTIGSVQNSSCS
jgi:Flp pilus assembly protein TadG